jgi:ADP-ribose pyrophosphatase YjhB (NUDIX family)
MDDKERVVVGAIVEHPEKGYLFQLRSENAERCPLQWSLFGGHVKEGETKEKALYRELEEELLLTRDGISNVTEIKGYRYKDTFYDPPKTISQTLFHVTIDIAPKYLTLQEGEDMRFYKSLDDAIDELDFAFNVKKVLMDYNKSMMPVTYK